MTNYSGVSQAAFDLIVAEEVSSQAAYTARYQHPERPGGQSGITVGIGYDCGYATAARIRSDWGGRIPPAMVEALAGIAGLTGDKAQGALAGVRPKVTIPWAAAIDVFANTDIPKWAATVRNALPNCDKLSPDCFGVLVSLAYNRGASFSAAGDRYQEMRAIRAHMVAKAFSAIPGDLRDMKRLWTTPSVRGVATRREHEAVLFERGLSKPVEAPISSPPGITAQASKNNGLSQKPASPGITSSPPSITNPAPGSIGAWVASIFNALFRRKS